MTTQQLNTLQCILDGLMRRYQNRVPDVQNIINCMVTEQIIQSDQDIVNDHIAFRTMGVPHLGIHSLEKIFLYYGYTKKDYFHFSKKKLDAFWYAPPNETLPRIFISELKVPELSNKTQSIIQRYTDTIIKDPVDSLNLDDWEAVDQFLHTSLWDCPSWEDYTDLKAESEYASWVIYNRYYLNHFTITIHDLPKEVNTISLFNKFLEKNGFKLNDSNGKIKTSQDGKLIQSATVSEMIQAKFIDKNNKKSTHEISGSYVEFAERLPLKKFETLQKNQLFRHHRRDGFDTSNANGIFESTYSTQTKKQST